MMPNKTYLGSGFSFRKADAQLKEIQKLIGYGYKNCTRRTYLIRLEEIPIIPLNTLGALVKHGQITLPSGSGGRKSFFKKINQILNNLDGLLPEGCQATGVFENKLNTALDVGFTYAGLQKLKIENDLLEVFRRKSPAFYENAFSRSPLHVGDTGLSAPQYWDSAYQDQIPGGGFHLALIAHFPWIDEQNKICEDIDKIKAFEATLISILLDINSVTLPQPLNENWIEIAIPLPGDKEHFGYKDGITAPLYTSVDTTKSDHGFRNEHALGEIFLGHRRNDGDNLYADLGITRKASFKYSPKIQLQPIPLDEANKVFFKNSSFGVLRKMEQRVSEFNTWVADQAQKMFPPAPPNPGAHTDPDGEKLRQKWLRSKLLGRTPEGVMLTAEMQINDISDKAIKVGLDTKKYEPGMEMGFHQMGDDAKAPNNADPEGRGCPFSSHIRRMNPRDDPVTPFIHRPLLRRGMPYEKGEKRGMLGLFLCADIVDQFEHLVGKWAQNGVMGIPDDSRCRDPLIGNHEPQHNTFYLNSHKDDRLANLAKFVDPFVVTRGCAYIWFPSAIVLRSLDGYMERKLKPNSQ